MSNDALPRQQDPSQSYPKDREPAIRVVMMPRDTNPLGTIFGGVILSHIDIAAAIEAHRHYPGRVVTIAMDQVVFKQPVFVGDLVSQGPGLGAALRLEARQLRDRGLVTLVAVDDQGRKVALTACPEAP